MFMYVSQSEKMFLLENFCGMMAKVMVCSLQVSKFEIQSHCYIHFLTNTIRKGMNPLILLNDGLNDITAVLLQVWLCHLSTHKGLYCH